MEGDIIRRILKLSSLLLTSMILLASCGFEVGGESSWGDDCLYIKGTARLDPETKLYVFDSARIFLNGIEEITDRLEPTDPKLLAGDIEDNVLFVYRSSFYSARYTSEVNDGYVFDEWKLRSIEDFVTDDDIKYETYAYRKALEGIDDARIFLDSPSMDDGKILNRYSESPDRLRYDMLPYIYPEYNRAPEVLVPVSRSSVSQDYIGNGTTEKPYTLDEFRELNRDRKEINVHVRVKDTIANNDLSRFFTELSNEILYPALEEVHVKLLQRGKTNADIATLLDRFDYVEIENVDFGSINLTDDSPTSWKFRNCHFDSLTITTGRDVILENCTYDRIAALKDGNIIIR